MRRQRFELGDQVTACAVVVKTRSGVGPDLSRTDWGRVPVRVSGVVGRRVVSDGVTTYPGGDDPGIFQPTTRHTVYLVDPDLRRAHVSVLPEDLRKDTQ